MLGELDSAGQLPAGWGVETGPGLYRVRRRDDEAVFGHSAGPQSWKQFLHPPRRQLWSTSPEGGFTAPEPDSPRYAFLGVRGCDLAAISILGNVLGGGQHPDGAFARVRRGLFVIAANCTEPGGVCFCASMGTGPAAGPGYDIALTEQTGEPGHRFIAEPGTAEGARILAAIPHRDPRPGELAAARAEVAEAEHRMGREMPAADLPALLRDSRESPHWQDVASRCLTCGNCTMVCPTCFCTTTEDVTDLTGDHAERWQRWASCFELDFSYVHGGACGSRGRAGTGSGSATSSAPGMTSSARRAASAAAGASTGARSASTSPRKSPALAELADEAGTGDRVVDQAELISDFPVLARLSPGELAQVSATARRSRFDARERVFSEGQQAEGCWLIHDGRVALDVFIPGRGLVVVQTLGAGDVLGWSWLVPPYRWHFGATATERHHGDRAGHRAAARARRRGSGFRLCPVPDAVRGHAAPPAGDQGPAARPVPESW